MSKLASTLPTADKVQRTVVRKGPNGACDVYGDGDLDDWQAVERLRKQTSWQDAQNAVDATLGVKGVKNDDFRYHWRGNCRHWTVDQKQAIRKGL